MFRHQRLKAKHTQALRGCSAFSDIWPCRQTMRQINDAPGQHLRLKTGDKPQVDVLRDDPQRAAVKRRRVCPGPSFDIFEGSADLVEWQSKRKGRRAALHADPRRNKTGFTAKIKWGLDRQTLQL